MSKRFSIEAVVSMIDKVSGPMGRASKSVTGFSRKMKSSFSTVGEKAQKMNKGINRVGGRAAQVGMAGLAVGAALAAREYVKFDDAIFGATARFKAAEKPGTDMAIVMENLRKAARKAGSETQFSAVLMAQGLDKFALAGFNSAESISILQSQIELATVSGEDFMQVADFSSDLLGGFGGAALDSAAKVAKLKEMNALLAVGTLSANVTIEDLFESLKTAAPIATTAGIAMKDVIAATSVLGSAGIKGTKAGTAMMNMFVRLAAPTSEVAKGFKMIGLRQKDFINQSGSLKNIGKIFEAIGKKTKDMSKVETLAVFDKIFGKRALAGSAVMSKNLKQLRVQLLRMGKDPQKAMAETAAFMRQSLGNRIKALSSAATELSFKFFEAFAGKGKDGLTKFTDAIKKFDVKPIIETLKIMGSVIGFVYGIVKPFLPLLVGLIVLIKLTAAAQTILNLVMMANPVMLIVAGVALLAMGFVFLVKKAGGVGEAFKWLGKVIFNGLMLPITGVLFVIEKLLSAASAIPGIGDALKTASNAVKGARQAITMDTSFNVSQEQGDEARAGLAGSKNPLFNSMGRATTGFASPNSRTITNNNNTQGRVDVNINDPKNQTTVEQSGIMPPTFNLATGEQ